MYDRELVTEILKHIEWSLNQIAKRFNAIESSDDFIKDDAGIEKLDSICMQMINIGEALKQIDKLTDGGLPFCWFNFFAGSSLQLEPLFRNIKDGATIGIISFSKNYGGIIPLYQEGLRWGYSHLIKGDIKGLFP